jgi:hypothetical protein
MKTTITISKLESQWASFGGSRLVVSGDGFEFRVADNAQTRKTYVIGRIVDIEIKPRKP